MALVTQNIVQAVQSLRPYQQECVKKSLDMLLKENVKRQLVSLPVGSGKTVIPLVCVRARVFMQTA